MYLLFVYWSKAKPCLGLGAPLVFIWCATLNTLYHPGLLPFYPSVFFSSPLGELILDLVTNFCFLIFLHCPYELVVLSNLDEGFASLFEFGKLLFKYWPDA